MADIAKILNKKKWTGRELGRLELTNMALGYKNALTGQGSESPIVSRAQLEKMLSSLDDREQIRIYNGYIGIHRWISVQYNVAQTQIQQAQLQYRTLSEYITDAVLAEHVFQYIEQLPAIMTQKQYDDLVKERREASFKDDEGNELYYNIFNILEKAIHYYVNLLQSNPKKANPLKTIRKKYIAQPVKSSVILDAWNEVMGRGYYTLEDGSGRRSDEMTEDEWKKAIAAPAIKAALLHQKATDGNGFEWTREIAEERLLERSKVIFEGGTEADADKAQEKSDVEKGYSIPVKWHYYETPPEDLTKWDVLEQDALLECYAGLFAGADETEGEYNEEAKDFFAEFEELVTVVLKDIDAHFFKGEKGLEGIRKEDWGTTCYSARQLYDVDFFGVREDTEDDTTVFDGNGRALFNGIAIFRPSTLINKSPRMDENGYYTEPEITGYLSNYTLEAFFSDAEDYAENIKVVESARRLLAESYYYVRGYNTILDLIAEYFDVPEISVFKMYVEGIEKKIENFNDRVPVLYRMIYDTRYEDEELKSKKLQVLKDFFQPIKYKSFTIPADNLEAAKNGIKSFKAFEPEHASDLVTWLCVLPKEYEEANNATDVDEWGLDE